MATSEEQRLLQQLGKLVDERMGQIIGIAAVVAALPETAGVDTAKVKSLIGEFCNGVMGPTAQLRSAADKLATGILQTAKARSTPKD
jgi:hypothetical protein